MVTKDEVSFINHRIITKPRIIRTLEHRYKTYLAQLRRCGFEHLAYISETTTQHFLLERPLWVLQAYLASLLFGEVIHFRFPLNVDLCTVVMKYPSLSSYALVFGMGVLFQSGFVHGGMLITTTYETIFKSQPNIGYYRVETGLDVQSTWAKHQQKLQHLEFVGHVPEKNLSVEHYTSLSEQNDRINLKLHQKKK